MKRDFSARFGFVVNQVAKLYGEQFDRAARAKLGLSLAQCRLLGAVAVRAPGEPASQAALAEELGLSAMGVASLCDRMAAGGWIERRASDTDRRVNEIHLLQRAEAALDAALAVGDAISAQALAGLSAAERKTLVALLRKAREGLLALNELEVADGTTHPTLPVSGA
jgi:DNA-binding MarR family transcriptional regulator